jgi:hypothetical protein
VCLSLECVPVSATQWVTEWVKRSVFEPARQGFGESVIQWICKKAIHSASQEVTDSSELANVWAGYLFTRLISHSLSHSAIQKMREIFILLASEWASLLVRQSACEKVSRLTNQSSSEWLIHLGNRSACEWVSE